MLLLWCMQYATGKNLMLPSANIKLQPSQNGSSTGFWKRVTTFGTDSE